MTSSSATSNPHDAVLSDISSLAAHLTLCDRTHDQRFRLGLWLERLHRIAAPRIISVGLGFAAVALIATWMA